MHTIFASSASAHGRVHMKNVRNFPQTEIDNRIDSPFLLKEHGDPQFSMHEFKLQKDIYNISQFDSKKSL